MAADILVVDDEADIRELIAGILTKTSSHRPGYLAAGVET
jgi:DNA-binding NtrC family response regulator